MAGKTQQKTQAPEDPLADLREEDAEAAPEGPSVPGNEEPEPVVVEVRPMVSKETQEQMVTEAVVAFHQDPTTQGFLHGGGQCGCRYVARVALQATVPVMTEEDLEEKDLTDA